MSSPHATAGLIHSIPNDPIVHVASRALPNTTVASRSSTVADRQSYSHDRKRKIRKRRNRSGEFSPCHAERAVSMPPAVARQYSRVETAWILRYRSPLLMTAQFRKSVSEPITLPVNLNLQNSLHETLEQPRGRMRSPASPFRAGIRM